MSQLGLIRVGKGDTEAGFALIDEAMAAALAGERSTLDTVVYACCDMLNACELASDIDRATQWCEVADDFVDEYGCPFLYAECRIYYGSVLTAKGRWDERSGSSRAGLRITEGSCPGSTGGRWPDWPGCGCARRLEEAERCWPSSAAAVEAEAGSLMSAARWRWPGGMRQRRPALEQRLQPTCGPPLAPGGCPGPARRRVPRQRAARRRPPRRSSGWTTRAAAANSLRSKRLAAWRGTAGSCRASGDGESAVAQLEAALEVVVSPGPPATRSARTRLELGHGARLGANPTSPSTTPAVALAGLRGARRLGRRPTGPPPSSAPSGSSARPGPKVVGMLTRREQEVLRLLAAGLSNPEIAERLHVSRKTASHHVSNILAKLGLRNRAEAAAHAVAMLGTRPVHRLTTENRTQYRVSCPMLPTAAPLDDRRP